MSVENPSGQAEHHLRISPAPGSIPDGQEPSEWALSEGVGRGVTKTSEILTGGSSPKRLSAGRGESALVAMSIKEMV